MRFGVPLRGQKRPGFEQAMLPHLPRAYRYALRLLADPDDARDAVQDAYLRACAAWGSQTGASPLAWLLAILRNVALGMLNRRQRNAALVPLDPGLPDPAAWPDTVAILRQDERLLAAALGALPLQFREVLTLREIEDLSYAEIAQVLGVPAGTVMSRLARARAALRTSLRPEGAARDAM